MFYDQKDDKSDGAPQENLIDTSVHKEAIMSQSETRLDDIPENKPLTRGRSIVRSAARKMKRSLSRKRSKQKEAFQSQQQVQEEIYELRTRKEHAEHHDTKSMPSRASRASRASSRGQSMTSRANSSKGAESSTRQSSNMLSDEAQFRVAPMKVSTSQPTEDKIVPSMSPVSGTQYQAQETPMGLSQPLPRQHYQRDTAQAVPHGYGDDADHALYGMTSRPTSSPEAPPSSQAPAPILKSSAPPVVTESQLLRQRSSNRNNKNSVDCLLRRMRSESTEEENDGPFEGLQTL